MKTADSPKNMQKSVLRVGTRSSTLARIQTAMVCDKLHALGVHTEVVGIETTGDSIQHKPLWDMGGKGLFCKQLDTALLHGTCDICVHSAKDLPTRLTNGVCILGFLCRGDVRDVIVGVPSIADLPVGAVVGTASPRRAAQMGLHRPDVRVVPIRGNVPTRLKKCADGVVDAILLAYAGLYRLGYDMGGVAIDNMPFGVIPVGVCIPASAQGAIAVTCRHRDYPTYKQRFPIFDPSTYTQVMVERAVLRGIDGDCHSPIGVHTHIQDDKICVQVFISYARNTTPKIYKKTYGITNAIDKAFKIGQDLRQP